MNPTYHEGELAVQERAGVHETAERVGRSIRATIPPPAQEFLANQPMAIIAASDRERSVWASLLTGAPGFMRATSERTLRLAARPVPGDPLDDAIAIGDKLGVLAIEPATRRRMRLNGDAADSSESTLEICGAQVYSNCPKYIQARSWRIEEDSSATVSNPRSVLRESVLSERQRGWIMSADTFFIASLHPEAGADASHRGGHPGFVRLVGDRKLAWGDYAGNSMFQTLGNLAVDPRAGLLFIDWERGDTLQLTGTVNILWDEESIAGFVGAERVIEFEIEEMVEITGATNLRWQLLDYSSFNPK